MKMTTKILLGRAKSDAGTYADGQNIYLTKHEWDCNWYWVFGYIGNANNHFHFDSLLYIKDDKGSIKYCASDLFSKTNITDKEWWIIRDLFVQAYALQKAAEVYVCGGNQSTNKGIIDLIKSPDMAKYINADLEKVLDKLWDFVVTAVNKPVKPVDK
jgi:hypothetical protein